MADGYLLSEKDRDKLRKLLGEHGASRLSPTPQEPLPGTSDVYVAKVQDSSNGGDGTIPPLIPATDSEYDHPGWNLCDIYQIMASDSGSTFDLRKLSNSALPVYNISAGNVGGWVVVIKAKSGHWLAATSNTLTAVELKTSLVPSGTATGWTLTFNAAADGYYDAVDYDSDPDATVYDAQNRFRCMGYDDAPSGDPGAIVYVDDDGAVVAGHETSRLCLCQLTAAQTGSDASFTVDTITVVDSGRSPLTGTTTTLTAYNTTIGPKCAGADNAPALIVFNETSGHWEIVWIQNVSQTVVTDYQIDGANKKFQKKTRAAWANWAGDESAWTDVHTGSACP